MKFSRIALALTLGALCLAAGIVIGRAQPEQALLRDLDEVDERLIAILEMPEPQVRARALSSFFSQLVPVHLETVDAVYAAHRFDVDAVAKVLFADWWARFDPAGALEGRIRPVWSAGDDPWVDAVIGRWVRSDPAAALAAVQRLSHQPATVQHEAYRALVDGWFERPDADPTPILRLFDHIRAMEIRAELYSVWAYRMVEARGPAFSLDYVENMPEDELSMRVKREMMGRIAGVVVAEDRDAAIDFATRHGDTEAGTKLAYYLVGEWARQDGPAAIEWATTLRSPTAHKVVERGWRNFHRADPAAADTWMAKQANSTFLEPAFALYLQQLARKDHAQALSRLNELVDERRRVQLMQTIGRSWIVEDPLGALAWMQTVELPPEVEKRILALAPTPLPAPAVPES